MLVKVSWPARCRQLAAKIQLSSPATSSSGQLRSVAGVRVNPGAQLAILRDHSAALCPDAAQLCCAMVQLSHHEHPCLCCKIMTPLISESTLADDGDIGRSCDTSLTAWTAELWSSHWGRQAEPSQTPNPSLKWGAQRSLLRGWVSSSYYQWHSKVLPLPPRGCGKFKLIR